MPDVVLAFPESIHLARHVRSTLLLGGIATLRNAGLYDRYAALVATSVRTEIESAVAGMWMPVEVAVAHYLACDQLDLPADAVTRLGRSTFDATKGLLLGTAIGIARGAGVTPWSLVPHLQRFWLRGYDGGGVQGTRLGPKELRIDVVACPALRSRYFRSALRGLSGALLELVSQKAYVHEVARSGSDTAIAMRLQWA